MAPIRLMKTRRYLIPRRSFDAKGMNFFVCVFILIAVTAEVLNDIKMLIINRIRAVVFLGVSSLEASLLSKID